MTDAEKVYSAANAVMSAAHVGLAVLVAAYLSYKPRGRVLRRLAPPLAVFFGTGAVSHAFLVTGCPHGVEVAWFVVRLLVTLAVVPWLWYGLDSLSMLPTKEEWDRQIKESASASEAAEAARREAERARADLWRRYEAESARARKVAAEYEELRRWAQTQVWGKLSEHEVAQLRDKLHKLLNAAV